MIRLLLACAALTASTARADALYTVHARTEAQAYEIRSLQRRSAAEPGVLPRQRLVQYLDLGFYEVYAGSPGERIDWVSSLRLDHDFGLDEREVEILDLANPELHLLFGYLSWTRIGGAPVDARLGRQVVLTEAEFFTFDGVEVGVHTPAHLGVYAFGGLRVTGTSLLGSGTFAPDGVRRRFRQGVDPYAFDPVTAADQAVRDSLDAPAPLFGARLVLEGVPRWAASVAYRRTQSRTQGDDIPAELRGYQIDEERLSGHLRWDPTNRLTLFVLGEQDLFRGRAALVRTGARAEVIEERVEVAAEVARINPTFDADSIWMFFSTGPRDEAEARVDVTPDGPLRFFAGATATVFRTDVSEIYAARRPSSTPALTAPGAFAGLATRPGTEARLHFDVRWQGTTGEPLDEDYLGRQLWLDGGVGRDFAQGRHGLDLRLSAAMVDDRSNERLRDFWSVGGAVLSRNRLSREASLLLILENNVNAISASDLRLYAILDLQAAFR